MQIKREEFLDELNEEAKLRLYVRKAIQVISERKKTQKTHSQDLEFQDIKQTIKLFVLKNSSTYLFLLSDVLHQQYKHHTYQNYL